MSTGPTNGAFGAELEISEDDRRRLGLEDGESVRVIHRGSRTILLERSSGEGGGAIPWDRDLVLSADVRSFPLADVLRMLHDAGKSGYLTFSHGDIEKSVYLNRGEVVFASSNQKVDRLGECLLRSGALTLEQLQEADRRWVASMRFGKVLVEHGFLTPRDLWNAVKLQVEDVVRSLFSHTEGELHFWEGEVQPDNVVRLALPTRRLVDEGLERRDELLRFLASLEDPRVRIIADDPKAARERSGNERLILEVLEGEGAFQALCREAGLDPLSCARTVKLLCMVGAVRVEPGEVPDAAGEACQSEDDRVRACVLDHMKLIAELAAPLIAVEGLEPVGERLRRVVEETSQRHADLLEGVRLGAGSLPAPEDVMRRALRLTGDRVAGVAAALGELVAYLEFELKNSVHIEEPDRFLEALEPFRAELEI